MSAPPPAPSHTKDLRQTTLAALAAPRTRSALPAYSTAFAASSTSHASHRVADLLADQIALHALFAEHSYRLRCAECSSQSLKMDGAIKGSSHVKYTMPDCKKSTALSAHCNILLAWDDGGSNDTGSLLLAKSVYHVPSPFVPAPSLSLQTSPASSLTSGSSRVARALFSQDSVAFSFGSQYVIASEDHLDWASAPPSWSADSFLGGAADSDNEDADEHIVNTTFLTPSPPPTRPSQGSEASVHTPASTSDLPLAPSLSSAPVASLRPTDHTASEAALLEVVVDLRLQLDALRRQLDA